MAETKTKPAAQKAATAAKPPASKKSAADSASKAAKAPKTAASKPVAEKKPAAAKKAPAAKKAAAGQWNPGNEERYNMVQVAAFYLAERDNFASNPVEYWTAAEIQITGMLPKK